MTSSLISWPLTVSVLAHIGLGQVVAAELNRLFGGENERSNQAHKQIRRHHRAGRASDTVGIVESRHCGEVCVWTRLRDVVANTPLYIIELHMHSSYSSTAPYCRSILRHALVIANTSLLGQLHNIIAQSLGGVILVYTE